MFKHILVPVDFSENALRVALYAQALADHYEYDMRLIHVYQSFQSGFQSASENRIGGEEARNAALEQMQRFLDRMEAKTSSRPEFVLEAGSLTDIVKEYCKTENPALIVMGTKGATGMKYVLLGSQTFGVARMTPKPLLIVPEDTVHFKLNKAGLLTDLHKEEQKGLEAFLDIFGKQNHVSLIHISADERDKKSDPVVLERHAEALGFSVGVPGSVKAVPTLPGTGVGHIVATEELDMLILTIREKSFLERLMNKSFSKSVIHHPDVPVLLVRE